MCVKDIAKAICYSLLSLSTYTHIHTHTSNTHTHTHIKHTHTHYTEPPSLSYTGSGYAHYTLTEEGSRQSRQVEEGLRSTYEDTVSLSLRTTHSDGVLFSMHDKAGSDFLIIEVCTMYNVYSCTCTCNMVTLELGSKALSLLVSAVLECVLCKCLHFRVL